jgi:hypothetical protein
MSILAVSAAVKLVAEFAPDIIGLFSKDKGDKVGKAVGVVNSLAESITGKSGDEAMEALSSSPELALEFKKALMADKHVAEEMRLKDVASAREMYTQQSGMADYVGKKIINENLLYISGLVIIYVLITIGMPIAFPTQGALVSGVVGTVGPILGGVINQLSKERSDVISFLFGSSLGSKLKDKLGKGNN